jgi:hypothetical protein
MGVIDMFIDIGDDHPVGVAVLPNGIAKTTFLVNEGVTGNIEVRDFNPAMISEKGQRCVSRAVVKDKVFVDQVIVMAEKEGQHSLVIPAETIQFRSYTARHTVP